jgi:hypothetical protein
MEGEGNSLKVLGFTQSQRNTFFQILMRLHSSYWFMIKEGFSWKYLLLISFG